jgi:molybdenum cofactor biosynthesis enzyme
MYGLAQSPSLYVQPSIVHQVRMFSVHVTKSQSIIIGSHANSHKGGFPELQSDPTFHPKTAQDLPPGAESEVSSASIKYHSGCKHVDVIEPQAWLYSRNDDPPVPSRNAFRPEEYLQQMKQKNERQFKLWWLTQNVQDLTKRVGRLSNEVKQAQALILERAKHGTREREHVSAQTVRSIEMGIPADVKAAIAADVPPDERKGMVKSDMGALYKRGHFGEGSLAVQHSKRLQRVKEHVLDVNETKESQRMKGTPVLKSISRRPLQRPNRDEEAQRRAYIQKHKWRWEGYGHKDGISKSEHKKGMGNANTVMELSKRHTMLNCLEHQDGPFGQNTILTSRFAVPQSKEEKETPRIYNAQHFDDIFTKHEPKTLDSQHRIDEFETFQDLPRNVQPSKGSRGSQGSPRRLDKRSDWRLAQERPSISYSQTRSFSTNEPYFQSRWGFLEEGWRPDLHNPEITRSSFATHTPPVNEDEELEYENDEKDAPAKPENDSAFRSIAQALRGQRADEGLRIKWGSPSFIERRKVQRESRRKKMKIYKAYESKARETELENWLAQKAKETEERAQVASDQSTTETNAEVFTPVAPLKSKNGYRKLEESSVVRTYYMYDNKLPPGLESSGSASKPESHAKKLQNPETAPIDELRSPLTATHKHSPLSAQEASAVHLPHLTSTGSAHMVSINKKPATLRTAVAVGSVVFSNPLPLRSIKSNTNKKGDVLAVARIAGIMAAKKTPEIIPLCHPIALTHVSVELEIVEGDLTTRHDEGHRPIRENTTAESTDGNSVPLAHQNEPQGRFASHDTSPKREFNSPSGGHGKINIVAKTETVGSTGVEMEAVTAVMGAAATVYDMCKAVDKDMFITDVNVVLKKGGRSGTWVKKGWEEM